MARFNPFGGKQVELSTQVTKLYTEHEDGSISVTVESLDDAVRNTRKLTSVKNLVPGNPTYNEGIGIIKQYLAACCAITSQLINAGELEHDKYNLLNANTKSFNKKNDLVNEILAVLKEERLEAGRKQREENPESEEAKAPFTEEQMSNIVSEPVADDVSTHTVEEETKDGGHFIFDKINYTVTVKLTDGKYKAFQLAPEKSWRATAIKWLKKLWKSITNLFKTSSDAVSDVTSSTANTISSGWKNMKTRLFGEKKPTHYVDENGDLQAIKK